MWGTEMLMLLATLVCFLPKSIHAFSQAPRSGCDVITFDGRCFSYFNSSGISWFTAGTECGGWGGHLATVTNSEQDTLLATIRNVNLRECWIGLNDMDQYNVWKWIDGSDSSYRNWEIGEPTSQYKQVVDQNCVTKFWNSPKWDDTSCSRKLPCYYCSTKVIPFQIQTHSSIITTNNTALFENITIQCITENNNTPLVTWHYVDLDGNRSNLIGPTDATTGVSSLSVSTDRPGHYSCQVTQQGGVSRTYSVRVENTTLMTVPTTPITSSTQPTQSDSVFTFQSTTYVIIAMIVLVIILFALFGSVNSLFCWWMARRRKYIFANRTNSHLSNDRVNLLDVTIEDCKVGAINTSFTTSDCNECVEIVESETERPDLLKIDSL